jgi:nucleoid-associated protein YgaU
VDIPHSYVDRMRRLMFFLLVCTLGLGARLPAQDLAAAAAARADREAAEERYKHLNAKLDDIAATQESLLKKYDFLERRISAISSEIDRVKHSQAEAGTRAATHDQIRELTDKMNAITRDRESDKKLILDQIGELRKLPAAVAPPPAEHRNNPRHVSEVPRGSAWEYVVQKGDTLSEIAAAYNTKLKEEGKGTITVDDIIAANPGLKPRTLYKGRKLMIPKPSKD